MAQIPEFGVVMAQGGGKSAAPRKNQELVWQSIITPYVNNYIDPDKRKTWWRDYYLYIIHNPIYEGVPIRAEDDIQFEALLDACSVAGRLDLVRLVAQAWERGGEQAEAYRRMGETSAWLGSQFTARRELHAAGDGAIGDMLIGPRPEKPLVFVHHDKCWPPHCGSARRVNGMLSALKGLGYSPVFWTSRAFAEWFPNDLQWLRARYGIKTELHIPNNDVLSVDPVATRALHSFPVPPSMRRSLETLIAEVSPNLVWLSYPFLLKGLPECERVIDMHDDLALNLAYNRAIIRDGLFDFDGEYDDADYRIDVFYQQNIISNEHCVSIATDEAARFGIPFIPTPIDWSPLERTPRHPVFVGSHSYLNQFGLYWFINRVLPILLAQDKNWELHVWGSVCDVLIDTPGIIKRGRYISPDEPYREATYMLRPMPYSTGCQMGVLEAMAYGVPVVGTKGMNKTLLGILPLSNIPGHAAAEILNLTPPLLIELALAGEHTVRNIFSLKEATSRLQAALETFKCKTLKQN
jgi:glycosyltransferase involved in cell wall biosynthesis